ncbi:unnamed protein product [Lupinus luteus]|uniref:Uncharacterized protein n=1 Tax=Lupinus luteus TaxID=3873 RepID=A0AAV1YLS1_LUPLU
MKALGEKISYQNIIEKVLRTLSPKFDHIVVAIEESKSLEEMKVEELQGSLEAHEQRLNGRAMEKSNDSQVLFTQDSRRYGSKTRGKGRESRSSSWKNNQLQG